MGVGELRVDGRGSAVLVNGVLAARAFLASPGRGGIRIAQATPAAIVQRETRRVRDQVR